MIINSMPKYKRNLFNIKIEIYYQIIKIIIENKKNNKYLLNKFLFLYFENKTDKIVL